MNPVFEVAALGSQYKPRPRKEDSNITSVISDAITLPVVKSTTKVIKKKEVEEQIKVSSQPVEEPVKIKAGRALRKLPPPKGSSAEVSSIAADCTAVDSGRGRTAERATGNTATAAAGVSTAAQATAEDKSAILTIKEDLEPEITVTITRFAKKGRSRSRGRKK